MAITLKLPPNHDHTLFFGGLTGTNVQVVGEARLISPTSPGADLPTEVIDGHTYGVLVIRTLAPGSASVRLDLGDNVWWAEILVESVAEPTQLP